MGDVIDNVQCAKRYVFSVPFRLSQLTQHQTNSVQTKYEHIMPQSFFPASKPFIWISIGFGALSIALLALMNADCYTVGKACFETCGHGCEVALGVYRLGEFVDVTDPGQPYTEWPIGFGILAYISLLLSSGTSALPLLVLQLIMLYLMGVIAANLTERVASGWGVLSMVLVVLNPSAIGLAITLKTDLVFAFVLSWAFLFLVKYVDTKSWRWIAWTGVMFGLATHVRPTTQYLILLLPVICVLLAVVTPRTQIFRPLAHGLIGMSLGIAVVVPWSIYMYNQGEGHRLYSSREELSVVTSHVNILQAQRDGKSLIDSRVENLELASEEIVRNFHSEWDSLPEQEKRHRRVAYSYELFGSFDLETYIRAGIFSAVGFFVSGGEGYLLSALNIADTEDGISDQEAKRIFVLKTVTRSFTILTRALGLFGLWWLVVNKHFKFLTICVGSISYFVVIHGFAGWSRFRIGVEIPLLVLSTLGTSYVLAFFQSKKSTDNK
jgi:hypothetical protein